MDIKLNHEVHNQSNICKATKMSSDSSSTVGKHNCHLCGYQTLQKKQLNLHALAVHDGKKFQCPECEYKTTQKSSLVSHHTSMHIDQTFQCNYVFQWKIWLWKTLKLELYPLTTTPSDLKIR